MAHSRTHGRARWRWLKPDELYRHGLEPQQDKVRATRADLLGFAIWRWPGERDGVQAYLPRAFDLSAIRFGNVLEFRGSVRTLGRPLSGRATRPYYRRRDAAPALGGAIR